MFRKIRFIIFYFFIILNLGCSYTAKKSWVDEKLIGNKDLEAEIRNSIQIDIEQLSYDTNNPYIYGKIYKNIEDIRKEEKEYKKISFQKTSTASHSTLGIALITLFSPITIFATNSIEKATRKLAYSFLDKPAGIYSEGVNIIEVKEHSQVENGTRSEILEHRTGISRSPLNAIKIELKAEKSSSVLATIHAMSDEKGMFRFPLLNLCEQIVVSLKANTTCKFEEEDDEDAEADDSANNIDLYITCEQIEGRTAKKNLNLSMNKTLKLAKITNKEEICAKADALSDYIADIYLNKAIQKIKKGYRTIKRSQELGKEIRGRIISLLNAEKYIKIAKEYDIYSKSIKIENMLSDTIDYQHKVEEEIVNEESRKNFRQNTKNPLMVFAETLNNELTKRQEQQNAFHNNLNQIKQKQIERQIQQERKEKNIVNQRQQEIRQQDLERQRQQDLERQRQQDLERQRQQDLERQRQQDLERQRQQDLERQRQQDLERQRQQDLEETEKNKNRRKSALVITWQNKAGLWWGNGPTQNIWAGEKTEDKDILPYLYPTKQDKLRFLKWCGRYKVYTLDRPLESWENDIRNTKEGKEIILCLPD